MITVWLETDVNEPVPEQGDFTRWAEVTLKHLCDAVSRQQLAAELALPSEAGIEILRRWQQGSALEMAIRVVGLAESQELNSDYRDKAYPTNVLSFAADLIESMPAEIIAELDELPLGDLVICAPVVIREAEEQGKPVNAHWAHMTVHGILHLLGHDHIEAADAACMEPLEVAILAELGCDNPYDDGESSDRTTATLANETARGNA